MAYPYALPQGFQGGPNGQMEQGRVMAAPKAAGQRALGLQGQPIRPAGLQSSYLTTPHVQQMQSAGQMQPVGQARPLAGSNIAYYLDRYNRAVQVPAGVTPAQIQQAGLTPVFSQPQRMVLPNNGQGYTQEQAAQIQQYLATQQQQSGIRPAMRPVHQSPMVRPNMQAQMGQLQLPVRRPSLVSKRSQSSMAPAPQPAVRPVMSISQPMLATAPAGMPANQEPVAQPPGSTAMPSLVLAEPAPFEPNGQPAAGSSPPKLQYRLRSQSSELVDLVASMQKQIAAAEKRLKEVMEEEEKGRKLLEERRDEDLDDRLHTFNKLVQEYLTARGASAAAAAFAQFVQQSSDPIATRSITPKRSTNISEDATLVDGEGGRGSLTRSSSSPGKESMFTPRDGPSSVPDSNSHTMMIEDQAGDEKPRIDGTFKTSPSANAKGRPVQHDFGSLFDWWLLFDTSRRLQQAGVISDGLEILPIGEGLSSNPSMRPGLTVTRAGSKTGSRPSSAMRNHLPDVPFTATIQAADEVRRAQQAHIDAQNRESGGRGAAASQRIQHVPQPLELAGAHVQLPNGQPVAATADLWRQFMATGIIQSDGQPDSSAQLQPSATPSRVGVNGLPSAQPLILSPRSAARMRLPYTAQAHGADGSPVLDGSSKRPSQTSPELAAKRPRTAEMPAAGQQRMEPSETPQRALSLQNGAHSGSGLPGSSQQQQQINGVDVQHLHMLYSPQLAAATRRSLDDAAADMTSDDGYASPFTQTPRQVAMQAQASRTDPSPSSTSSARGRGKKTHPPLSIQTGVPGPAQGAGSGHKRSGGRKRGQSKPGSAKPKAPGSRPSSGPNTAIPTSDFGAWTNDIGVYSPIAQKTQTGPFSAHTELEVPAGQGTSSSSSEASFSAPHSASHTSFFGGTSGQSLQATSSSSTELSAPPSQPQMAQAPPGTQFVFQAENQVPAPQSPVLDAGGLSDLLGSIGVETEERPDLGMMNVDGFVEGFDDFDWTTFAAAGAAEGTLDWPESSTAH